MRPHVVHVLHSLEVGGTENGVTNLVGQLRSEFRHTVVSMTGGGPLASRLPEGVAVHCLGKRPGLDLRVTARLVGLLRRLRPDAVHSRNWAAFDAVVAARLARVPVVIHGEHGREISDPAGESPRRNRLRRLGAPLITRFIAVSHDLRRWLVERLAVPAGKVVTIPNGVDVERFSPDAREDGRRILGVTAESLLVGTVGRLDPVKDQAGLVDAFARIAPSHRRAFLVVVGDGPCRRALEERVASLGLKDRVRFLGERSDVPRVLPALDLFVLSSVAEGMSNTVLEAMAAGVAVVATNVGGTPEMVDDGSTGTLVPARDPNRLAAALGEYLENGHVRALHGKAGRQRAVDEFSLARMAASHANLYRSLVTAGGRS